MLYLDTSVLVAAITPEAESRRVQSWLRSVGSGDLAISNWVATEFASALSIKVRTGVLTMSQRENAARIFESVAGSTFQRFAIDPKHFELAKRFCNNVAAKLRGGDALHLAVASDNRATLCTLDRRLAEGGSALGVATLLP